ncbi:hypothetical protein B0T25DRAFT_556952 [Lasiosphaeria hispida]|uniref:Pentatricopeptide repeat domain-containing protein n=1 Tax=Lasiosphaeria hispida TaxID=260671 RepID=A0AAJ0HAA2_9PEZI|nr:hypothetical protein B0T25DRAFT_556952 [Lasiosphaeria hispida]
MQGIWSMARPRGCHCQTCLRAVHTIARRATSTATRPGRRKVLASDVSTACYSAIMATAAVLDAGKKDERRHELGHRIYQAKSSLAMLMEKSAATDLAQIVTDARSYPNPRLVPPQTPLDVLDAVCRLRPEFEVFHGITSRTRERTVRVLHRDFQLRVDAPSAGGTLSLARCEDAVAFEEANTPARQREPASEHQFSKSVDMVNELVDQLLKEAYLQTELETPNSAPSPNSLDSAWNAIRMLRSDKYPRYNHPEIDPSTAVDVRARLNTVNNKILAEWVAPRRERFVAKICYNLLVTPYPPGVQNYNNLILGFTQLGEHRLAQVVVDSFLFKSHFRPTQATILCLLQHYRLKKDLAGFHGLIRRLLGHDPRGIGLRRKFTPDVGRHSRLRNWANSADIIVFNGYAIERARLEQSHFEAILEGLLDFKMIRQAASLFVACLRDKCALSVELLDRLLRACTTTCDFGAARILIDGLFRNMGETTTMILGPVLGPRGPNVELARKIRLLLNVRWAHLVESDSVKDTPSLPRASPISDRVTHLVTSLWLAEISAQTNSWTETLKTIKAALSGGEPLNARLDSALAIFGDESNQQLDVLLERNDRTRRMAKFYWLYQQTLSSQEMIKAAEGQVFRVLEETILWSTKMWKQTDRGLLRNLVCFYQQSQIPGTRPSQVASCFAKSRELDTQLQAVLLEALPLPIEVEGKPQQEATEEKSLDELFVASLGYLESINTSRQATEDVWAAFAAKVPKKETYLELLRRGLQRPLAPV